MSSSTGMWKTVFGGEFLPFNACIKVIFLLIGNSNLKNDEDNFLLANYTCACVLTAECPNLKILRSLRISHQQFK